VDPTGTAILHDPNQRPCVELAAVPRAHEKRRLEAVCPVGQKPPQYARGHAGSREMAVELRELDIHRPRTIRCNESLCTTTRCSAHCRVGPDLLGVLRPCGPGGMHDPANQLRRISLLRGWVNRPQEGGRRKCGGVSVLRYSSSSGVEARPSISLRCGWRPKRAITSRAPLS
jgi:hypothetical protein